MKNTNTKINGTPADKSEYLARPSFDEYFINMAKVASARSEDVFVQHGAILVNENNHPIGTGYNAFPTKFDISLVDIYDRDARRPFMVHAEQNAILNATLHQRNTTMYVTGEPCIQCLLSMINFGVKRVCYVDVVGTITDNDETRRIKKMLVDSTDIVLDPFRESR